jgi:hypothetical protein
MLIHVIRTNDQYDYVKDFMLDRLIESHSIVRFRRSGGWVTVGDEPIRLNKQHRIFIGRERRTQHDR